MRDDHRRLALQRFIRAHHAAQADLHAVGGGAAKTLQLRSGTPVPAENLANTQLFDQVFEGDVAALMAGAVAFAEKIADVRPLPLVRNLKVVYPNHEAFLQMQTS